MMTAVQLVKHYMTYFLGDQVNPHQNLALKSVRHIMKTFTNHRLLKNQVSISAKCRKHKCVRHESVIGIWLIEIVLDDFCPIITFFVSWIVYYLECPRTPHYLKLLVVNPNPTVFVSCVACLIS